MVKLQCPIPGCTYETSDGTEGIAIALLTAHTPVHTAAAATGPKLERPKLNAGITLEEWNIFQRRWEVFVDGSRIGPTHRPQQLFQCASEELGNSLLKSNPQITSKTVEDVMNALKSLAVIAVATGVLRAELLHMSQDRDEPFRSFASRVRGKAETCTYTTKCTCNNTVDFTDIIIRDVLIGGIADLDIRREILGTKSILDCPVNDVVSTVESKEMARNALPNSVTAISSFKRERRTAATNPPDADHQRTSPCPHCKAMYHLYTEGPLGWNARPHRMCIKCYRERRKQRQQTQTNNASSNEMTATFAQISTIGTKSTDTNSSVQSSQIRLAHHIFSSGGWHKARFLDHPRVNITISTASSDYQAFGRDCPSVKPSVISAMADSGAQSCLWSYREFRASGFADRDLIPVSLDLVAANKSTINISGAVILRLQGNSSHDNCATMVYISKDANGFYLSCEAMIDLKIVPANFPCVGAATTPYGDDSSSKQQTRALNAGCSHALVSPDMPCSCPARTVVPERPSSLPIPCTSDNNDKMKEWLLNKFASSTFNTCPHRPLPCMSGPPVEIHVKDDVTPKAIHKPSPIPVHWQEKVHADLLQDEKLGVIEKVPYGEPASWCHRMVVTRKHTGSPRRTVDLSPLNKYCDRETFSSESPFHLARKIPKNTWKTVTDAWNGYHSVPLRKSDRHLTTFITPYGRWRYTRAPQGFLSSGDGYNRRFDTILKDFQRKERCVDDTIHYDTDLETHWWRTIDFLRLLGESGIVLNPDKFSFAQESVDFAGFRISQSSIEPLPKYLNAIRDFPTPKSTTDIRSWFGLVNQVSNYAQLRDIMAPFKPFLSPKHQFLWTDELEQAFELSKHSIIKEIYHGVEIFDPTKHTCLRTDWSQRGIGYFLLQKHCQCSSTIPECCSDGWRITLAGSRFLSSAEQRYAPVEGEALAVAWSLEHTKYFTQGCNKLVVVTDHKPLVKILGDRTLDEITNTRIFRLKQRTLLWSFDIVHLPGKTNAAADATSRHPSTAVGYEDLHQSAMDQVEIALTSAIRSETKNLTSLSWELLAKETSDDPTMHLLLKAINNGFPDAYRSSNIDISPYWIYREALYVSDGVIIYNDRVVVPPSLRPTVLQILHSAHQGVSSMESRARAIVFWPGMTEEISSVRKNCFSCIRTAPSQAAPPAILTHVPSTPFESVFGDFFDYAGCHFLIIGDRLSGWVEIFKSPHGTAHSGANGLLAALRIMFSTFGVPEEIASDGGPEFTASITADFLKRWGIVHRKSSAYFPQSNGRAEVAVKKAKRILMENVGSNGSLDNDSFLRAILQVRNTPDPDCNVSPAEIVFGRPIRDAFSFVSRCAKFNNPSVHPTWRQAWQLKENAMRVRLTRNCEKLNEHTRKLATLAVGDHVFVQNQNGPHPTKWDKSGTVVEAKQHDQYVVKIDGSSRLTVRNRRFLRKFTPASLSINNQPTGVTTPKLLDSTETPDTYPHTGTAEFTNRDAAHPAMPHATSKRISEMDPESTVEPVQSADPADEPVQSTLDRERQLNRTPTTRSTPLARSEPEHLVDSPTSSTSGEPDIPAPRSTTPPRSRRQRQPRRLYIPETGQWQ